MAKTKHFKASYCLYLVSDTHILFFLFVFLLEKSLGFVYKEILISQTQRKPKKSPKQKQERAFSHKDNV